MEHERPHLDRQHGDVERGVADVFQEHTPRHAAPHAAPPVWLTNWEDRRPVWLVETIAEIVAVFFYVYAGVGASAAFFLTTVAREPGFGSLLNIGLCYGLGIVFGIVFAAIPSGGHLSPSYTIAFAILKGFPWRKVPRYILSQIFGAFLACGFVYVQYRQEFVAAHTLLLAEAPQTIFTPQGPAGVFGLFPNTGQQLGYVFLNEFIVNFILAVLVFSCLDASNFFASFTTVPFIIGAGYAVMIWAFAADSLALNTARDLGGRMICSAVYGTKCWTTNPSYTALAALTNIPAAVLGGLFQTLFISDSARTIVHVPPPPSLKMISRNGGNIEDIKSANGTNGVASVAPTFSTTGMTHSSNVDNGKVNY